MVITTCTTKPNLHSNMRKKCSRIAACLIFESLRLALGEQRHDTADMQSSIFPTAKTLPLKPPAWQAVFTVASICTMKFSSGR